MQTPEFTPDEMQAIRAALEWTNSPYFEEDAPGGPETTALHKVYQALDVKPSRRRRHTP